MWAADFIRLAAGGFAPGVYGCPAVGALRRAAPLIAHAPLPRHFQSLWPSEAFKQRAPAARLPQTRAPLPVQPALTGVWGPANTGDWFIVCLNALIWQRHPVGGCECDAAARRVPRALAPRQQPAPGPNLGRDGAVTI